MKYREIEIDNGFGQITKHIIRNNKNNCFTSFPADPDNTDYQEYLKWVAEGNEPLPPDAQD
jgi:hypothetical protein